MLEQEVFAHLSTTTAITQTTRSTCSAVSTRIYPIWLPDFCKYPAISYIRVTGVKENHLTGYADLENVHLQVSVWAETYKEAKLLSTVVHTVMLAATAFSALLNVDNDIYEDEAEVYRVIQDYSIWDRN